MTPTAAINHVLDSVDGLEIDGGNEEVVSTLLAVGTSIIGVALQRLGPREREALLRSVELRARDYISKVTALQAARLTLPKVPSGNGKGNAVCFLGANGTKVS
jgi:hypothetical protein